VVRFAAATCRACPVRQQCTRAARTSTGRQLMLRPRHLHQAVQATRAEQATSDWKQRYAIRAGVEGTIHQAVAVTGVRRSRYVGLAKTHLAHVFAATAINLIRLDAWWTAHPSTAPEPATSPLSNQRHDQELGNRICTRSKCTQEQLTAGAEFRILARPHLIPSGL